MFRNHTPTYGWLAGKIVVDIAKLTGVPLGAKKAYHMGTCNTK